MARFSWILLSPTRTTTRAGVIVTTLCMLCWIGASIAGVGLGGLIIIGLWPRRGKWFS